MAPTDSKLHLDLALRAFHRLFGALSANNQLGGNEYCGVETSEVPSLLS